MTNSLFKILKTRYTQLGGLRLVRQYAKMGLLWSAVKTVLRHPFDKQSYKQAYFDTVRKVEPYLMKKYAPLMRRRREELKGVRLEQKRNKTIWFCWLQGLENAPDIVKVCHRSLERNLGPLGYKVVVIDEKNWRDYVELPDYVIKRREKKQIPPAHFSDLLRLELLIKYGGTWIDATVLCTGSRYCEIDGWHSVDEYMDSDLFMFQYTRPGSSEWGGIGNWFISACTNNEVLIVLRDMLYAYWEEHDCVLDYYMFHLFFSMLRDVYPEQIEAMPYFHARINLQLVHHWGLTYNEEKWNRLTERTCFHKLAYMVDKEVVENKDNYYNYIIEKLYK